MHMHASFPNRNLLCIVIAFDRTDTIYVVFQSRGFYNVPLVLIADARSFSPPFWTDWHTWPRPHASIDPILDKNNLDSSFQARAAFLWISKVRGHDHICGRWSAKKNTQIPVIKLQTHRTHFSSLWLLPGAHAYYLVENDNLLVGMRDRVFVNAAVMTTVKIIFPKVIDVHCFTHTVDRVWHYFKILTVGRFLQLWNS